MKLSIITINYNNAEGLRKTLASISSQSLLYSEETAFSIEHIIVDGGSTDGSVAEIQDYEKQMSLYSASFSLKWISEPDNGIYHAINKGIRLATGDYVQILNSGDQLATTSVISHMATALTDNTDILYGNMIKAWPDGRRLIDKCGEGNLSMLSFYHGTLNHDPVYIRKSLFDRFGLYDESMKICSDWKWYVNAIAIGGVKPQYVDIDVTIFDMNGISESGGKNAELIQKERRAYLEEVLPASILRDYDSYAMPILQYQRLKKHHVWGIVHFLERVLFKLEKWHLIKK